MPVQVQGNAGVVAEVESATRAVRATLRPTDPTTLGAYRKSLVSGSIAAGMSANSPVYSFRYGAANLALVKYIVIGLGDSGTAFAAGVVSLQGFVARSFTASDSSGTAGTLTGNNGKLRTSFATTGVSDIRIANTGTLSAGTRTLDTDPFVTVSTSVTATSGQSFGTSLEMLRTRPGDQPLVLAQNEGFIIQANVPATGLWQLAVDVYWDEVSSW